MEVTTVWKQKGKRNLINCDHIITSFFDVLCGLEQGRTGEGFMSLEVVGHC